MEYHLFPSKQEATQCMDGTYEDKKARLRDQWLQKLTKNIHFSGMSVMEKHVYPLGLTKNT